MLSDGDILSSEVSEAFTRILSVAKVLLSEKKLSGEDRESMAENIEEPLYNLAGLIGADAAARNFASLAETAGLEGWR